MKPKQKTNVTSLDLYKLALDLEYELIEREGVTDTDLDERLESALGKTEDKLDSHRYAIDHFNTKAKMLRTEVQRLQARARSLENVAARIKNLAQLVLEARVVLKGEEAGRKVETEHGIVYLRKGARLVIDDEEGFLHLNRHNDYIHHKPVIDKRAVTALLKDGAEVDCARLEDTLSVVFK